MAINGSASYPGLGGNATVPNDSVIEPAQAYVNAWPTIISNLPGTLSIHGEGVPITDLTEDLFTMMGGILGAITSGGTPTFNGDMSGEALDSSTVDAILGWLHFNASDSGSSWWQNGSIDMSGGTNAPPTPEQIHIDEIDTFQFNYPANNGDSFAVYSNSSGTPYWVIVTNFDNSIPLASSSYSGGLPATLTIGIQDNPSAVDMAAKWASILEANGFGDGGGYYDLLTISGATVTGTSSVDGNLPFGVGSCASCTGVQVKAGQNYERNNDLNQLVTVFGWTVNTN